MSIAYQTYLLKEEVLTFLFDNKIIRLKYFVMKVCTPLPNVKL